MDASGEKHPSLLIRTRGVATKRKAAGGEESTTFKFNGREPQFGVAVDAVVDRLLELCGKADDPEWLAKRPDLFVEYLRYDGCSGLEWMSQKQRNTKCNA